MTRTIAYIRVSTDKQVEHGVSLEAQQSKLAAYAQLYDLELVETVTDAGLSAKTLDRPGLQQALAMLKAGHADALLVVKLDRLTRSVADLGRLIDTYFTPGGAALMSVSEQIDTRTAAGRLILNILGSVSQWERETIGERTRDAMRHKQAQGEYIGGEAPYGFQVQDGVLIQWVQVFTLMASPYFHQERARHVLLFVPVSMVSMVSRQNLQKIVERRDFALFVP